MGMNKNTVLSWATFIMIFVGVVLILLGVYRYEEVAGWGFASVGIGFFAIAWVFNALKGRV
ncbi:MAG: CAL67264 family membrane protein [Polaribacter sp.]